MKQLLLTLAIFCIVINAYTEEIEIGKTYTETEIATFTKLVPFIENTITNRTLSLYKLAYQNHLDIEKIVTLRDKDGKLLDAIGLDYQDNTYEGSTLVTDTACVAFVKFDSASDIYSDKYPHICFLYVDSESAEFKFFEHGQRWIDDICVSDGKIYYYNEASIRRIDIATGITFDYRVNYYGYYVDLHEVTENGKKTVFINCGEGDDDNARKIKQFVIDGDKIIPATKKYIFTDTRRSLSDYIVKQ